MIVQSVTATATTAVTIGAASYDVDGNLDCFLLEEAEVNPAKLETTAVSLPQLHGGLVIPGRYGVREVRIRGTIHAPDRPGLLARREELIAVFSDHGDSPITLTYVTTNTRSLSAYLSSGPSFRENPTSIDFEVDLVCPDPVSYSLNQVSLSAGASPGQSVSNVGNAVVYPVLTITADTSTVSSFRIGSTTQSRFIEVSGISLPADGTEVVIDCTPGQETVVVDGAPALDTLSTASSFFSIQPGTNLIYITDLTAAGNDNARATVTFTPGYIS